MPESDPKSITLAGKVFAWLGRKNLLNSRIGALNGNPEPEPQVGVERNLFQSLQAACNSTGYAGSDIRFTEDLRSLFIRFSPPSRKGDTGPQGLAGARGKDAFDKFAVNPRKETMMAFSWKGVRFEAPIPNEHVEGFPHGPLKQDDIDFIEVVYGTEVISRMATFWRREYDYNEDVSLFKGEKRV